MRLDPAAVRRVLARWDRATWALVAVGVAFFIATVIVDPPHTGFGIDEVDYLARVNPKAPELYWSSVRAWGTPVLAAPVAVFAPGIAIVRLYFGVVLSAGLVLSFWPWRRLVHPAVAPLAAFLFGSVWITLVYGNAVMPNLPIAYGCIAATGLWGRLPAYRRRLVGLVGLGAVVGFVALVRPSDSLLLLAPLVVFTLFAPGRRRVSELAGIVIGEIAGWVPWVVEAYARFGGPVARWRAGDDQLTGLHLSSRMIATYPRLYDDTPAYCCYSGPVKAAGPYSHPVAAWMLAVVVLAVLGLVAAAITHRLTVVGVVTAVGAMFVLFYVGLLNYGAPRFLLPILGLLAVPVATALVTAVTLPPRPVRLVAGAVCLALVAGHLWLQVDYAGTVKPTYDRPRNDDVHIAVQMKPYVRHKPCLLIAPRASLPEAFAYYLDCHVAQVGPGFRAKVARDRRRGWSVVGIFHERLPAGAHFIAKEHWTRHRIRSRATWYSYHPPTAVAS